MNLAIDTNRYVGLPYSVNGLGDRYDVVHCWGLVRLVYREALGIALPAFDMIAADNHSKSSREFLSKSKEAPWHEVKEWQPFDVVVMLGRIGPKKISAPIHCGLAVDHERLMHVEEACATVLVRADHPNVRQRIFKTYRHEELL